MNVRLEVRGLPELQREMQRLSAAVQTRLARNAAMAMARVVAKYARLNAPVETGRLRASIKARKDPERRTGSVQSFANGDLRLLPAFGNSKTAPGRPPQRERPHAGGR